MHSTNDSVDLIRVRCACEVEAHTNRTTVNLKRHDLAFFSIDNIDQRNHQGLAVSVRVEYGEHITAIKGLFFNTNGTVQKEVKVTAKTFNEFHTVQDANAFVNDIIPRSDDFDIFCYVEMFVGKIYHHEDRIKTNVESNGASVKMLICSMFEGFGMTTDNRYVDFFNENSALKSTIHNCIGVIHQLYDVIRNED